MKKRFIQYLFLGISLFIMSCSDDSGKLPLDDDFVPCRFDFPQGTGVADQKIQKIHDETGVYIIYKNIVSDDLNRNWVDPDGSFYEGTLIPEDHIPFYLEYLNDNLLKYVEGKYLKNALPVYLYFLNHLVFDEDYYGETIVDFKTDGMDFWALGLSREEIEGLPAEKYTALRNRLVYVALNKLVDKGIISAPDVFSAGIDYETTISKSPTTSTGGRDRNYYRYRGFVDFVDKESFLDTYIPLTSEVRATNADLLSYIRIALYYTEEAFQEEYPQETCSLINDRYQIIISHLKKVYNIDLKAIAKGI